MTRDALSLPPPKFLPQGPAEWSTIPGLGYRLAYPALGVRFDLTRLRHDEGATTGLLTVRVSFRGALTVGDGIVSSADFNCCVLRTRKERAHHLADRTLTTEIDWFGLLETLCLRVLEAEDAGEPVVPLEQLPALAVVGAELTAGGLPLLARNPTIWFGDGGTGKSYLALYAALDLVQRGERVLYVDWEFSGEDHRQRLTQLAGPVAKLPTLWYLRADRPLPAEIERIRRIVGTHGITVLMCDSVGFGCTGSPEKSEAATTYFQALRLLGPLTSLHLAHVNKSEQGDQKPFGSAFWHHGARATWFLKRSDAEDQDAFSIGFYHRKANTGRLRPAFGVRLRFMGTETQIRLVELDEPELTQRLPLWQRMRQALRDGAMTATALAESLDVPLNSVVQAAKRKDRLFLRMVNGNEPVRIGLLR